MSREPGDPLVDPAEHRKVGRVRLALMAIVVLLAAASPLYGPRILRRMDFFRVRRVEILGARYVAASDILARLNVDMVASVWDPVGPLIARVSTNPEIERVNVRRKLPGTLVVEVTERVPVALVPSPAGMRPYDAHGIPLPIDPTRAPVDAPVLAARDTAILRLLGQMRDSMRPLYDRVSAIRRTGADEILFELPALPVRAMADVSLNRLADIAPVEADLTKRALRVAELDLRYRDQVVARLQ